MVKNHRHFLGKQNTFKLHLIMSIKFLVCFVSVCVCVFVDEFFFSSTLLMCHKYIYVYLIYLCVEYMVHIELSLEMWITHSLTRSLFFMRILIFTLFAKTPTTPEKKLLFSCTHLFWVLALLFFIVQLI